MGEMKGEIIFTNSLCINGLGWLTGGMRDSQTILVQNIDTFCFDCIR